VGEVFTTCILCMLLFLPRGKFGEDLDSALLYPVLLEEARTAKKKGVKRKHETDMEVAARVLGAPVHECPREREKRLAQQSSDGAEPGCSSGK
jgi:hypothetical protein